MAGMQGRGLQRGPVDGGVSLLHVPASPEKILDARVLFGWVCIRAVAAAAEPETRKKQSREHASRCGEGDGRAEDLGGSAYAQPSQSDAIDCTYLL